MKSKLVSTLEALEIADVYLQGTYPEDEDYPEKLITYSITGSPSGAHYNNHATRFDWSFYVNVYAFNPVALDEMKKQVRDALLEAGFIVEGKGRSLVTHDASFIGWNYDVVGIEKE